MPFQHVNCVIRILSRFSNKSEWVVASPLFSLFFKSVDDKFVDLFFLHEIRM